MRIFLMFVMQIRNIIFKSLFWQIILYGRISLLSFCFVITVLSEIYYQDYFFSGNNLLQNQKKIVHNRFFSSIRIGKNFMHQPALYYFFSNFVSLFLSLNIFSFPILNLPWLFQLLVASDSSYELLSSFDNSIVLTNRISQFCHI